MQFDERINLEIMERFAEADIKLALPAIGVAFYALWVHWPRRCWSKKEHRKIRT
jgi:hypothetical protein